MDKAKQTTIVLLFFILLSFSVPVASFSPIPNGTMGAERNVLDRTPQPSHAMFLSNITYTYGLNVTVEYNRTINIENFGVLSINDTIKIKNVGNETITHFNYTLANINTAKLSFVSFRVANGSVEGLNNATAIRIYKVYRTLNYTTFVFPFYTNETAIADNSVYYIRAYLEFAQPYSYTIESNEQVLHYRELLYPLLNNVPINNGTVEVTKQGGDKFLDDANHPITPSNDTANIVALGGAGAGTLKWLNITRQPFNYTQDYNNDLMLNVYVQSISTVGQEEYEKAASTILFKATSVYRRIEINPYGYVIVKETQHIVSLGPERPENQEPTALNMFAIHAIPITMPENATVLNLYDDLGALNLLYQLDNGIYSHGSYNIRQSEKFPGHPALLVFSRYPLYHGDTMNFTIIYKVPLSVLVYKEQGTPNYYIKMHPSSLLNWTVDKLTLDVVFPKGTVIQQILYRSDDPYQSFDMSYRKEFYLTHFGFKRILSLTTTDFSGSDNSEMIIYFSFTKFNLFLNYIFLTLLVVIVLGAYVGFRELTRKVKEITETGVKKFIPVEEIRTFVKLYEEKLGIQERVEETQEKIARKKLKAREGRELLSQLRVRYRKIEEELQKAKAALGSKGARYREAIHTIEIAERKLQEERKNLRELKQEYRKRKTMTKESYSKLLRERRERIEKLKTDIDGTLIKLRLLIEE